VPAFVSVSRKERPLARPALACASASRTSLTVCASVLPSDKEVPPSAV
jgi:hypothetical protein